MIICISEVDIMRSANVFAQFVRMMRTLCADDVHNL